MNCGEKIQIKKILEVPLSLTIQTISKQIHSFKSATTYIVAHLPKKVNKLWVIRAF